MLTFDQPLLLLLLIPIGVLVYLTWKRMSLPFPTRQRFFILACRAALFTLIIMALAGAAWTRPVSHQATIFVGDISSSTGAQRSFIEQWIGSAIKNKRPDDQIGIVAFGRNALVEQSVKSQIDFSRFESTPDTNYTDLAAGLRLASAILPSDSQRHIVLLTDGQQNLEDALQEARLLQQQGIRLDIVPLPATTSADARIDGLEAPTELRTNERFTLHVKLYSTVAQQATLRIYLDQNLQTQQSVSLAVGQQELTFSLLAPPPGFHTFRVTLEAPQDAIMQNDQAAAFVNVQGPPRVLVVEGQPGNAHNITAALQATHIDFKVISPGDVPTSLDGLAGYSSIILSDVPAVALGIARMQTIQSYVRDLGRGLVVSGGQNSYGIGGYAQTPLEQTLPVRMDIPQHKDNPSIAVVLIIESLEAPLPINISKEAAKGVINLLSPQDQVAISQGDGILNIPMQHVTNKAALNKSIDAMNPNDPPSYTPDLISAEQALLKTDAKIKHVILLGDGDAFDNYAPQVLKMANENITVSTVATNSTNSQELGTMVNIANWGKGRFYRADDQSIIPEILLKETQRASRRSIINDTFTPAIVGNHPILTGLNGLPELDGYVATTPKPAAQMVLVSHKDDPVLSVWQYGLGRVAAWTSDSLGLWTNHWLNWDKAAQWWANVVTWTLPAGDSTMNINGRVVNGNGQLTVDLPPDIQVGQGGQQEMQATIITPENTQETINLQPTTPQRWEGNFPATQVGAYLVRITWQGTGKNIQGGSNKLTATTGLVVPYAPEFHTQGNDTDFLRRLAQAGQGTFLDPKDPTSAFKQNLAPVSSAIPIAFLLLILAALLLPVDIAARRLSGFEFLTTGYRWLLARLRGGSQASLATSVGTLNDTPAVASLNTIRARRAQRQQKSDTDGKETRKPERVTIPSGQSQATPTPEKKTTSTPKEVSVASSLLEAKRKRSQKSD